MSKTYNLFIVGKLLYLSTAPPLYYLSLLYIAMFCKYIYHVTCIIVVYSVLIYVPNIASLIHVLL